METEKIRIDYWEKAFQEKCENERRVIKMIGELALKMIERNELQSLGDLNKIMMAI